MMPVSAPLLPNNIRVHFHLDPSLSSGLMSYRHECRVLDDYTQILVLPHLPDVI